MDEIITMDIISKQTTNRHDFLKFNPNKSTYYEIVNMILCNVIVSIIISIGFSSAFNTGYQYIDDIDIIDEEFAYHPSNGCGCRNVRVTAIFFPYRGARQLYPGISVPDNSVPDNLVPDNSVPDNSVPDNSVPDNSVPDNTIHYTPFSCIWTILLERIQRWKTYV